jgi:putative ABC transport system permease protein
VLRGVIASAAWKVAAGVTAGLTVAIAVTRGMRSLLYGVEPLDAMTYAAVIVLVAVVVAIAAYAPAARAARVDPLSLMRAE